MLQMQRRNILQEEEEPAIDEKERNLAIPKRRSRDAGRPGQNALRPRGGLQARGVHHPKPHVAQLGHTLAHVTRDMAVGRVVHQCFASLRQPTLSFMQTFLHQPVLVMPQTKSYIS